MWTWVADLPTTNFRIFVSIMLAVIFVLSMIAGIMLNKFINVTVMISVGTFVLTMMGLDVAQYAQKRKTYVAGPPNASDAEDAAAGASTANAGAK